MLKTVFPCCLAWCLVMRAACAPTAEERDFSDRFGAYSGAFVVLNGARDHWVRYHPERCRQRVSPMSTFKVLNALISLECGVATGPEFTLPWDGVRRSLETWNRDQTLRSAFSGSCVWYFQALAERVGAARMQKWVTAAHYGNMDTSGGLTRFWLESSLKISPDEQVDFLRRLHARQLPFAAHPVDVALDLMTVSKEGATIYRGKTGTAFSGDKASAASMGWWVGSVTTGAGGYYFATNITGGDNPSGQTARKITEAILRDLKILPPS